jgi:type IV pilus assembly protein PilV
MPGFKGAEAMTCNEKGFSLIEVLMAITIFAIGFLAMAAMQTSALKGNNTARGTTEAAGLLQAKVEELRMAPYEHAFLDDSNTIPADGILGEANNITFNTAVVPPDPANGPGQVTNGDLVTVYGNVYQVFWNVAEDWPVDGLKTVRVIVAWNERGIPRRIFSDFIRSPQF